MLLRFGVLLLLLQLSRIVFLTFNSASFTKIGFSDVLAALYFDSVTLGLVGLPLVFFSLLPFVFVYRSGYQLFLRIIVHLISLLLLSMNLMDVVYFSYTSKRSTMDLFTMLGAGNDFGQQFGSFLRDFWFLIVFMLCFVWILRFVLRKIGNPSLEGKSTWNVPKRIITFSVCIAACIVLGRGGFGLKPVSPIDASQFTRIENTALVLNTPFTLIKSFNKTALEEKKYMSLEEEQLLFSPIRTSKKADILPAKTNVVILILESFGNEWVGAAGAKKSFTPFLDSLIGESLYFKNGIANAKKSNEAVPSILASMPSLSDNPYISSPYATNKIQSLAQHLKLEGYSSSFFHGATNGSMNFDGFAAQAGFDQYFGRKEYNNEAHYDGTWGILDEYFNPWMARKLTEQSAPFLATLFTISSHHPYYIPPHMRGKLRKGPQEICESIHYGDYSLKQFFKEAKKQPWFENTLFVICADHTSATNESEYNQRTEMYKIPIVFYHPSGKLAPKKETQIFQQLDIFPTILDLLNIEKNYYAFGQSYFQRKDAEAITYLEGTYHYYLNQHLLTFSNEKARNLYNVLVRTKDTPDSISYYRKESQQYEKRLKALIQCYNRDLILNQTTVE
jgi:phosphoglycerol transferase MdoB-like AlkP superfamily enzyme